MSAGPPEAGYAKSGDLHIAYHVAGGGPIDVVLVPGLLQPLEAWLVHRPLARLHERLTRFARVIGLDKRGTGQSDRLAAGTVPTIEERIDDVRAVMDAAGSRQAVLMAFSDGGQVGMVFAATYPERVRSLVLFNTSARLAWAPDSPWGRRPEQVRLVNEVVEREWGTGAVAAALFGVTDASTRRALARLERLTGTPSAVAASIRAYGDTDVRDVLATIMAPTLVVHESVQSAQPLDGARYLAEHVPNAQLVELPGAPLFLDDDEGLQRVSDLVEKFITGHRRSADTGRVLKTVLFSDIVSSTERAVELGDGQWTHLLDDHDAAVSRAVEEAGGRNVNTTGDGMFAAFDGPARAISCAQAIARESAQIGLAVRVGIHTGECEPRGSDYAGIAVHIGARVAAAADAGEILVTGTVRDLVAGSGIEFIDRGRRSLKGVPGDWQLLAVASV